MENKNSISLKLLKIEESTIDPGLYFFFWWWPGFEPQTLHILCVVPTN